MDKQELEEVIGNATGNVVGGFMTAILLIAALPFIGGALLSGLAGAIAAPEVAGLVIAGLFALVWLANSRRKARWARERAEREARTARLKELHGGKDRYFIRESSGCFTREDGKICKSEAIKLMSFCRNEFSTSDVGHYACVATYSLDWMGNRGSLDMRKNSTRIKHWQTVFEAWVETGGKPPSQKTWYMFPNEAARANEQEAKFQESIKPPVYAGNCLTPVKN